MCVSVVSLVFFYPVSKCVHYNLQSGYISVQSEHRNVYYSVHRGNESVYNVQSEHRIVHYSVKSGHVGAYNVQSNHRYT